MQDPLKQGLKLILFPGGALKIVLIRMQDPLKQGLKLGLSMQFSNDDEIRMQDPLKQGLKLIFGYFMPGFYFVFECKIH